MRALEVEHPVATRRPTVPEWARDLLVAHAGQTLGVEVTRSGLRHQQGGVADWKRWRLATAVKRAVERRRRRQGGRN